MTPATSGSTADLYSQAMALYARGDASAAALFEKLLVAEPAHVAARYKLANLNKEAGALDAALAGYEEVLRLEPMHAEAMNNLGAVHQMRGDNERALACYRQSIASDAALSPPAVNLGRLLQSLGRNAEAASVFGAARDRGLDAGLFGHLLAAASGESSASAPASYVRETFDAFAPEFEQRLVGDLDYRVPELLADFVRGHAAEMADITHLEVLDLGCGTGLVGDALGGLAGSIVGVDLSPRMLEEARKKNRYASLHEADIAAWLRTAPEASFDLVVAADVFIYIGDLDRVISGAARVLRTRGMFAFSIESCAEKDWQLLPSGRYAQSESYIAALVTRHGFQVRVRESVEIRRGAPGVLYLIDNF